MAITQQSRISYIIINQKLNFLKMHKPLDKVSSQYKEKAEQLKSFHHEANGLYL